MADPAKYRSVAEHDVWKSRDPIPALAKRLLEEGIATQPRLDSIAEQARATVTKAVAFAESSPWPVESEIWEDIYV
jgi:pyruvate dehydrogenase E1 component alpha subunit